MANFVIKGTGFDLFDLAPGRPLADVMILVNSHKCVLRNWDGSRTQLTGTGLVWNAAAGNFTGGTIASITHSANGKTVDLVSGLNLAAQQVQAALENATDAYHALQALVFAGNDVMDARGRLDPALPNYLVGYGGDDKIFGGEGADELWGLNGRDSIVGGGGDDFINGGLDDDVVFGGLGVDRITGDGGADRMNGSAGNDILFGGAGNDIYDGSEGTDYVVYTRSLYDLIISKNARAIIEPNGQDTLNGIERYATDEGIFVWNAATQRMDKMADTPGALLLNPDSSISGTDAGEEVVLLDAGKTIAFGLGGNDTVTGRLTYDLLLGGAGNDSISGDANASQTGGDRLYGEDGNDMLLGMGGGDLLYGGKGMDQIAGGNGSDTITGGANADIFIFKHGTDETWGADVINDFQLDVDKLQLDFEGADAPTPTLSHISPGWLVSLEGSGSVLLKGLHVPDLTLDDLLV